MHLKTFLSFLNLKLRLRSDHTSSALGMFLHGALILFVMGIAHAEVYAQGSQVLSVTPPLFQLSTLPGDIWQSSVKVVNGNSYPLTVYTEVVNFTATGETGQGKFSPRINGGDEKSTLASWITIARGPHVIPPEQTTEVSFFVEIPDNAPPGGHYAAILVSTEEPKAGTEKLAVKTSQAVTSLFFVRIEGDVKEEATIREFRVVDPLVPTTNAEFSLRFENKGNVHLQPRGDIVITNMWGAQRGTIPVNYQTHFGNVLPASIRDFKFTWNSEFRISDIGRYKAIATLAYGEDEIQSATAVAYFWVVPLKATFITLVIICSFIALIVWMIKLYVRRMLTLAGVDVPHAKNREVSVPVEKNTHTVTLGTHEKQKLYRSVSAPFRSGVIDLRRGLRAADESVDIVKTLWMFICRYKMFFISVCVLIGIFVTVVLYIGSATDESKNYQIIINEGDTQTTLEGAPVE